tara:strand:- start:513 stop:920 length:408 start_codon:yes stop_codon:yes gene_type:complete
MDNFDLKKYLAEGMFSTSYDGEQVKVEKALDRWVEYSMEHGDSEADVMSVGENYLRDSIHAYIEGTIDDDDLAERKLNEEEPRKRLDSINKIRQALSKTKDLRRAEFSFLDDVKAERLLLNLIDHLEKQVKILSK